MSTKSMRLLLNKFHAVVSSESEGYYECKDRGLGVSSQTDECPECGSDQIACYRIE